MQTNVVTEDDLEPLTLLLPLPQVLGLQIGVCHSLFMWFWGLNPTATDIYNLAGGVVHCVSDPGFHSTN